MHEGPRRSVTRASGLAFVAVVALSTFSAFFAAACSDTPTTTLYTPQTGIVVRSETLTTGIGCGTGSTQIFKFVAVAIDANGFAAAAGIYDCFADGVLVNLQPAPFDAGYSLDYTVSVYAFNQSAYTASQPKIASDVAQPNIAGSSLFARDAFSTLGATYTTSCTATEQGSIQVVAVCDKLATTK